MMALVRDWADDEAARIQEFRSHPAIFCRVTKTPIKGTFRRTWLIRVGGDPIPPKLLLIRSQIEIGLTHQPEGLVATASTTASSTASAV
jgi:hypothetical protein